MDVQISPDPSERAEFPTSVQSQEGGDGDRHRRGCINSVSPCSGGKWVAGAYQRRQGLLFKAKVHQRLGWPENVQEDPGGPGGKHTVSGEAGLWFGIGLSAI